MPRGRMRACRRSANRAPARICWRRTSGRIDFSTLALPASARVISATSRDLDRRIDEDEVQHVMEYSPQNPSRSNA